MKDIKNEYYGVYTYKKCEPLYYSKEADYDETQNLLSGKPCSLINYAALDESFCCEQYNSKSADGLTNGIYAKEPTYTDPAWFRFTRGVARSVIFDMGGIGAVEKCRIGALKEASTGVSLPSPVAFSFSENGVDWQTGCTMYLECEPSNAMVVLDEPLKEPLRARFVRVSFKVEGHIYLDRIEVFGRKNPGDAKSPVAEKPGECVFPDVYADQNVLKGAKDVLLSYICHENAKPITKEVYMPHTAYIVDGEIKDTLFDSFLFLPYVAFLYDKYTKRPLKKADWQHYIDVQFAEGVNMDALDAAIAETGAALGKPDLTAPVFFSLLYPVTTQTDFGEVYGRNLDFSKQADRLTALEWLVDVQLEGFKAKNYKHLTLGGFYWFTEEISYSDGNLLELIRHTTDYVRSKGSITTWIPYYLAKGYDDWRRLGFDTVCYQPNYAFNQKVPDQRLYDASATARLYGMCIELEIGGIDEWNIEHTKKYYAAGAQTGYMQEATHMYYQGGVPGAIYKAYISEDARLHSMYDDTYKFIKGTYGKEDY